MRVNGFNSNYNMSFGHRIIMDVGASSPKGTLKVLVQSDDGTPLIKSKGYLNNTPDGFINNQYFINKVSAAIRKAHKETLDAAKEGKITLSDTDKKLSGVSLFVPGTTYTREKDDIIAFIPNLRDKSGESLVNIDFTNFEKRLKTLSPTETGVDINKDKFEFTATKDLGGCGLAIAKILGKKGQLNEGDYIMGIMTGGGFGSVDIKVKDGKVEFETSESSSYLTASPNGGRLQKLGRLGVSVKSNITHYFKSLNLPEFGNGSDLLATIIKAGDARIVTQNEMHVSNLDTKIIDTLSESNLFRIKEKDNKNTVFELNDDEPRMAAKIKKARISAIKDYAEAVSLITVNKINDCLNKVILVGPFAQGVNAYVQEHPDEFKSKETPNVKDLSDLIKYEVKKRIDDVDLPSSRRLATLYKFDVICSKDIDFPDNTFAGDVLLNPKLKFVPNRGSWFSIPVDELQNPEITAKLAESQNANNSKTIIPLL